MLCVSCAYAGKQYQVIKEFKGYPSSSTTQTEVFYPSTSQWAVGYAFQVYKEDYTMGCIFVIEKKSNKCVFMTFINGTCNKIDYIYVLDPAGYYLNIISSNMFYYIAIYNITET